MYAGLNETINLGLHLAFFFLFVVFLLAASRNVRCMPNGLTWILRDSFFFFFTGRDEDRVYIR